MDPHYAFTTLLPYTLALVIVAVLIAANKLILRVFGVVIVPEDGIGVVKKKWVLFGSHRTLPDGAIVALQGEAGYQAQTLPPGVHFWLWPWQFEVVRKPFITIPEGKIGVVEARDGRPLPAGRVLARRVECVAFQDAAAFLRDGGERGPQMAVLPPGTYRINYALFSVELAPAIEIGDNMVGVVTTKEGAPLPPGEIAGRPVGTVPLPAVGGLTATTSGGMAVTSAPLLTGRSHNMYQDGQAFVDAGGNKGLQEQVMLAGRYFVNPLFATVEEKPMTSVPIAHAGVVIAYVGEAGSDVTGVEFRHGNLVERGRKGVWVDPLDPGMYAINPYTHKVELVPTQNVVLNWATGKTEAHQLDKNLSTITVRSADGFTFNLDVSQIIHIPRNDAPRVIARFGSVANLVTQVLEPTIGNYFRNSAQGSDVIDFLRNRQQRQQEARTAIAAALTEYNVGAVNTLIGDITPPADLMKTLTDRKLAEQQQTTFETQKLAEVTRKDLAQARAMADTQPHVVEAERKVTIAGFDAESAIKTAEGQARSKEIVASADAMVLRTVGEAEAAKVRAVGTSEADVIKLKIVSMEAGNYAGIEIARHLSTAQVAIVPEIVAGGSGGGEGGLIGLLLATYLRDRTPNGAPVPPKKQEATP